MINFGDCQDNYRHKMGKDNPETRVLRKRTRSEKGLQFDEMKKSKSPKAGKNKQLKLDKLSKAETSKTQKNNKTVKPKASRRIVFDDGKTNKVDLDGISVDQNNNATLVKRCKGQNGPESVTSKAISNPKAKIIDPCFKRVWEKEMALDAKTKMNKISSQVDKKDGINLDVENEEDLDYVDDLLDDELSYVEDDGGQGDNNNPIEIEAEVAALSPNHTLPKSSDQGNLRVHVEPNKKSKPVDELNDEQILAIPRVKNLFNQFWDEKMKELKTSDGKSLPMNHSIKSPSDTTIYALALQKSPIGNNTDINHIVLNFVDSIRSQHRQEDLQEKERRMMSSAVTVPGLEEAESRTRKAVIEAEKFRATIAEPEKGTLNETMVDVAANGEMEINQLLQSMQMTNQVTGGQPLPQMPNPNDVAANEGMLGKMVSGIPNIGSGVSDDDFFHLTCHIEPSLIHKIEKGEFVELEKLLPKDKFGGKTEDRLEWVQREGGTFLVPAQKDSKIGSFRKWEQAFRAYATIYCGANPHRSKEIWQYITVINTAASSYLWDNVYNYDITFRHLMAFNPSRSWAVTYNQMWNLSMRDPIPRSNGQRNSNVPFYSNSSNSASKPSGSFSSGAKRKSDYCWNFNKGVPCKFGSKCKFVEKCKYCDSSTHGVHACPKLAKKTETSTNKPVNNDK